MPSPSTTHPPRPRPGRLALAGVLLILAGRCALSEEPKMNPPHDAPAAAPANRLAAEKSPYLLQHAHNPVDWFPWGAEALAKARKDDKPVFLSIGYSTCHWCHVMAHESFEDPEVARLLNEAFVCIKVDREERPDVDGIYMAACQMLTGSGGWPLTIVMTPDGKPFFAATYIPKQTRFGRTGLVELIPKIREAWTKQRDKVLSSAASIAAALQRTGPAGGGGELDEKTLAAAADQLVAGFDEQCGGFGAAPKFPTPHNLLFLLRHWKRTGDQRALHAVERTLQAMRRGGIFDHLGYGFHRYATDREWLVPHFEKMLYDQALIALACIEAFQATGDAQYQRTAREIFTYVLRDMTSPEGGFYSAEDADSEGVEGKCYLWSVGEVRQILGPDDADLAIKVYNLEKRGNFLEQSTQERTGTNILHLTQPVAPDLRDRLETIRGKLFDVREKRIHPHKDDKILTDWNGLMIAALARAAQAFDEPRYAQAAIRAAEFIVGKLRRPDGRLLHSYRGGAASSAPAHVDDYAFLASGLLDLYEATFDVRHLETALALTRLQLAHYWDAKGGGFYVTPDDGEKLLVRQRAIYDGAVPSGNSVAMLNLLRLARVTGDEKLEERAAELSRAFAGEVAQTPLAHTQFLCAVDYALGPSYEIVIAGKPQADDTRAMLKAIRGVYVPNKVVLLRPSDEEPPAIARIAPFTKAQRPRGERAAAYVCQGGSCNRPTTDTAVVLRAIGAAAPQPQP